MSESPEEARAGRALDEIRGLHSEIDRLERENAKLRKLAMDLACSRRDCPTTGWIAQPNRDGWWLWREGGRGYRTELLLLTNRGAAVATDDEFQQATHGLDAEQDGFGLNYWECTDTTQRNMPGQWLFLEAAA